jgi:hypothetical protein
MKVVFKFIFFRILKKINKINLNNKISFLKKKKKFFLKIKKKFEKFEIILRKMLKLIVFFFN